MNCSRRAPAVLSLLHTRDEAFADAGVPSRVTARLLELLDELDELDGYVRGHGPEVSRLAVKIGRGLGLANEAAGFVAAGALLHDIGKLFIDKRLLAKPSPLSEAEWKLIRLHPALGFALLVPNEVQGAVLGIVRSHHERWDGGGSPDRIGGDSIPLGARIVATADAFCAMSEERPYRRSLGVDETLAELHRTSWQAFDGRCVRALLDAID